MERLSATYFNNGHVLQFLEDIVSEYCPAIDRLDIRTKKKKTKKKVNFCFHFFIKKFYLPSQPRQNVVPLVSWYSPLSQGIHLVFLLFLISSYIGFEGHVIMKLVCGPFWAH